MCEQEFDHDHRIRMEYECGHRRTLCVYCARSRAGRRCQYDGADVTISCYHTLLKKFQALA